MWSSHFWKETLIIFFIAQAEARGGGQSFCVAWSFVAAIEFIGDYCVFLTSRVVAVA